MWYTTIPGLTQGGAQVIAVDLPGFGRSDKPVLDTERDPQTYDVLGDAITDWFGKVVVPLGKNRRVTVVGQDWGGWTALRSIAAHPSAVAGHVSINAAYLGVSNFSISCKNAPPGESWFVAAAKSTEAMLNWQRWMKRLKAPDAGAMMQNIGSPAFRTTIRNVTAEEKAAFDAPMLNVSFYSVLYAMPTWLDDLIFESPAKSAGRARDDKLFRDIFAPGKPGAHIAVLTLGSNENFDRPAAYQIQCVYPGAAGQPHHEYARGEASHYSPMDVGPDMAQRILNFTRSLPMPTPTL